MTERFVEQKAHHFPMQLAGGIIGRIVDMPTYFAVEDALEPLIFPEHPNIGRWFNLPQERQDDRKKELSALQRATHQEAVVFYEADTAIGWSAGRMN